MNRVYMAVLSTSMFLLLYPDAAWAYLDPGSGSYLVQVVIGLVAGLLYTLRNHVARMSSWLRGLFRKTPRNSR